MQERYQTLTDLLQEIRHLNDLSDAKRAEAVSRGEAYNLFEVLGASTSELAHSAFIANLLTPHATHGLGFRPLQSFLEVIGESQWSETDIRSASVEIEKSIGAVSDTDGGRMDIVISADHGNKLIIIENKIYAGDQPGQLLRYKSYADNNSAISRLCYLTLDGHEADRSSAKDLKPGEDYYTLSYRDDIMTWLDECLKSALQLPLIRETIIQYRKTIEQLTGQQMELEEKRKLYELMLRHASEIDTIIDNDVASRRYVIENKIIPQLQSLGSELGMNFIFDRSFLDGKKDAGFAFSKSSWKNMIRFQFGGMNWTKLFYGVYGTDKSDAAEKLPGFSKPFNCFIYGWKWMDPINWKHTELSGESITLSIRNALLHLLSILDNHPDKFPM